MGYKKVKMDIFNLIQLYREISNDNPEDFEYPKCFFCKKNGKQHLKSNIKRCVSCIEDATISNNKISRGDTYLPSRLIQDDFEEHYFLMTNAIGNVYSCSTCRNYKNGTGCILRYDEMSNLSNEYRNLICYILRREIND